MIRRSEAGRVNALLFATAFPDASPRNGFNTQSHFETVIFMKRFNALLSLLSVAAAIGAVNAHAEDSYRGSSFSDVWSKVKSDPYASGYPHYKSNIVDMYSHGDQLYKDAKRTLNSSEDFVAPTQKLVHPIGICLAGTWNITAATKWTGYFSQGSKGLIVVRASEIGGNEKRNQLRSFGLAGKIFPTLDPNQVVKTANFHAISNAPGAPIAHFLDANLNTDIINLSLIGIPLFMVQGTAIATTFAAAELTPDLTQAAMRQQYPVAQLGEPGDQPHRAPVWLRFVGSADVPRNDGDDFRDELNIKNFPNGLRFDILASDAGIRFPDLKTWVKIGYIELTDSVVSSTCDRSLHFHHARWVGLPAAVTVGAGTR
ncbi:hypothetical protein BTN_2733 [Burkholderia thailandensis E254]|uniref:Uncharacterized protein n=2 Tax=Burkholderia thailandensis TaxID=57975 RepID=Q2SW24_BURTA|nr:hypothetical protein BTH_I2354 [Burkholderia thailandensis E264]AHI72990.1 hypothetical protein BTQ_1566 [Burkholderia thailandensis 2002721723]AIS93901.1 hypothetical protein BTHA_2233 [Burkholderia thailandensis MSMB59]AIT20670.1 hypothetical protein BTN_2733 [Burkholderia thailandensis E254]AJY00197.1 hypothetical protein BG87_2255 [Burkholderia thailandensis 2002721643]AOJ45276.1 hypothetical protein WJ27_09320 [Burkholderia thailandensis]